MRSFKYSNLTENAEILCCGQVGAYKRLSHMQGLQYSGLTENRNWYHRQMVIRRGLKYGD